MVPGYGPRKAKIVVVAEAPAGNEVREGRPFVGKAGEEAHKLFQQVGLDLDRDVYRTNASLEPVVGDKTRFFFEPDGRPTQTFIQGLAALMKDLNEIRPNVVIPMGNYALWALRQHVKIMKWRGSILWSDVFQVKCVPTIHPAALLWGSEDEGGSGLYKYRPVIIWDLERAKDQAAFPEVRLKHRTYLVEPTGSAREEALERLLHAKRITFDIEAPIAKVGLKCISFSDFDPTWAVCFRNTGPQSLDLFRELLETDTPKVGQNLMYDCTLLDQMGIRVRNVQHDTMLTQRLIYGDLPLGLDFMVSIFTDIPYYKDEGKESPDGTDWHQLMTYCCKDNCGTTEVAIEQEEHLREDSGMMATFLRCMKVFDPLRSVTTIGNKVDTNAMSELMQDTEDKRKKAQAQVDADAGYAVNVMSPKQVSHLVYDAWNLTPDRKTRSTEEPILMQIASTTNDQRLVSIIRTRHARKKLSSYLNYEVISSDGRIRWEYKIAGTKTGRLSCQIPSWGAGINGQTMPADVRRVVVPDDGWEFLEVDGMQAEAIVTAIYAQDPVHLDCFRTGKDVHLVTACLLIDKDPSRWMEIEKSSNPNSLRQIAKKCNHAFNYDMGYVTFMYTVNSEGDLDDPNRLRLDHKTAKALRDKYMAIRPALNTYWAWVRAELKRNRFRLTNPLGRSRLFLDKWSDTMHKDAYSWLPQGTVGDYTNMGIIQTSRALRAADIPHRLVAQTHDSAAWSFPKEARSEAVPIIMGNSEVPLNVNGTLFTIPIEGSVGDSLRKLEPKDPPEWHGLHGCGETRKVIDLTPDEYERMKKRMDEALYQ